MTKAKPRERVVIPTHYRAHVTEYAMSEWFEKHCPNRATFLIGVPVIYSEYVKMGAVQGGVDIHYADKEALEAVAKLVGSAVDREQSLVDWIEGNQQIYPSKPDEWLSVCTAAGFLITQVYFREFIEKSERR